MQKSLIRKGMVYAIVVLFIGVSIIPLTSSNLSQSTLDSSPDEFGYLRLFGENLDDDSHYITVWVSANQFCYELPPGWYYETPFVEVSSGVDISYSVSWYCDECDEEHLWFGFIYVQPGEWKSVEFDIYLCDDDGSVTNLDTGETFSTIQGAIDDPDTLPYHTIYVENGIYYENVVINKNGIQLMGENKDTTIIDGSDSGDVVYVSADGVSIRSFTIQNSGDIYIWEAGIDLHSNNNTIMDNTIINNLVGINFDSSSNNYIEDNYIINNSVGCNNLMLPPTNNNDILDNSFTLNEVGIHLWSSSGNNIIGNNMVNNNCGIYLHDSSSNTISGNDFSDSIYSGIHISSSPNNNILGNSFFNDGLVFWGTSQSTVSNNMVNGKPLVYLEEKSDIVIDDVNDAGQIILIGCDNITIQNQELSNTYNGIELLNTNNCLISSNNISNNHHWGVFLGYSDSNTISSNTFFSNRDAGIQLHREDNYNTISDNIFWDNTDGIHISMYSCYNTIRRNTILNSADGIFLEDAYGYNIYDNTFSDNNYGVRCGSNAHDNNIYHNNFIGNTKNAYVVYDDINIWDDGYPSGGNYWDDYTGNDTDSDGMGDTPCNIPTGWSGINQDRYPFINQDGWLPKITNITITASDPLDTEPGFGWENITGTVTDNTAVDEVKLILTGDTTTEYLMTHASGDHYYYNITISTAGEYTYHIWANDTTDNFAESPSYGFALPMNEDVDMNGQVYFDDLIAIVLMYGNTGSHGWVREDVDNNGQVYFDDLIAVVMVYGEWWK